MEHLKESRGYIREETEGIIDSQAPETGFREFSGTVIDSNGSMRGARKQIRRLPENRIRM